MKNKPTVVNFLAGPGAGKSTTAAAVFTLLKLHSGIKCELVTEFVKDLVWEERQHTIKNQPYIFSKQHHRIWRLSDKVEIVVTDAPILLSCMYNRDLTSDKFKSYVLEEFNKYDNLNFFINRKKEYKTYGRNESESEAKELDNFIKGYLSEHSIYYYPIEGDLEGINSAMNTILSTIGKKQEFQICKI